MLVGSRQHEVQPRPAGNVGGEPCAAVKVAEVVDIDLYPATSTASKTPSRFGVVLASVPGFDNLGDNGVVPPVPVG